MRGMGYTRLTEMSLVYFLIQELSREVKDEVAEQVEPGVFAVKHKPMVATKPIVVKYDGEVVSPELYNVYPRTGLIRLFDEQGFITEFQPPDSNSNPEKQLTVSYNYNIVAVVNESTDDEISPPLLAVENVSDTDRPLELGSDADIIECLYRIHLYGRNTAQRDDISDWVRDVLKKDIPIWNFDLGFPIMGDGRLNRDFDTNNTSGYIEFGSVAVVRNPLQAQNDPIEESRALVSCIGQYIKI